MALGMAPSLSKRPDIVFRKMRFTGQLVDPSQPAVLFEQKNVERLHHRPSCSEQTLPLFKSGLAPNHGARERPGDVCCASR